MYIKTLTLNKYLLDKLTVLRKIRSIGHKFGRMSNTAFIFEEWFATSPINVGFMAWWEQYMHHVHSVWIGST